MSRFETMEDMQDRAHKTAVAKGWWDAQCEPGGLNREAVTATIPEKLCLIHSETSEALEDYRAGKMQTVARESDGKPEGFPTELADIVIRVMDLAGALGIDLEREVRAKMAFNETRSYRHGGKVA
jgi:NTP pyrophosphatase (non-canonical NTP hydrolase)